MTKSSIWAVLGGTVVLLLGASVVSTSSAQSQSGRPAQSKSATPITKRVPRLVDLGAGKCIPCKAMAPILEELRVEYAGRMDVEVIDVWKDRAAGERYGIKMIPTQIFYAVDGRELWRHEGFMSRRDILEAWAKLGVNLT